MTWLLVFLGGGLGSLARYGMTHLLPAIDHEEGTFPWATLGANLLACIILGVGLGLVSRQVLSKELQLFVLTGFCGGYSTFSTFSAELVLLMDEGHFGVAAGYVGVSVFTGFLVLWGAYEVVR